MQDFQEIVDNTRKIFDERTRVRDETLVKARQLTRLAALTIRAIHRSEFMQAQEMLNEAHLLVLNMQRDLASYPDLYHAGYTQDAIKEFVEGNLVYAMVRERPLPTPEQLGAEPNTWLNGLAEAASELRRRILDLLRNGESAEAARLLDAMDHIYSTLVTFDFADQITGGLRRRTDALRAVFERTNGDVASSHRSAQLEQALKALEIKLGESEDR